VVEHLWRNHEDRVAFHSQAAQRPANPDENKPASPTTAAERAAAAAEIAANARQAAQEAEAALEDARRVVIRTIRRHFYCLMAVVFPAGDCAKLKIDAECFGAHIEDSAVAQSDDEDSLRFPRGSKVPKHIQVRTYVLSLCPNALLFHGLIEVAPSVMFPDYVIFAIRRGSSFGMPLRSR